MTSTEGWDECTMPGCHAACDPSEEFCAVHRETTPMQKAWGFLKGTMGSHEDQQRGHEQADQWKKIQQQEEREQQQQRMENPPCELCNKNPAMVEQHGDRWCEECADEILRIQARRMREEMGLPPEEAAE